MATECINYNSCPIISNPEFLKESEKREFYIKNYCTEDPDIWSKCKRYMMKARWSFCPDFILPDTTGSTDELLDKFENEG